MIEARVYTDDDMREALSRITFVNTVIDFKWQFEFARYHFDSADRDRRSSNDTNYGWLLWVKFERPCSITGFAGIGRGRDEVVWQGTTVSGVVKTAWLLVDLVVRHELMEGFRFDNARIFNPHNSVLELANLQEAHERSSDET